MNQDDSHNEEIPDAEDALEKGEGLVDGGEAPALIPERVSSEEQSTAVVPVGGLSAYMSEVGRHSLLSRREEYDLAVRLRESGDQAAAARLVTGNLRLVVKIAMEFQRNFMNVLDLIQEGNIGLMQAVAKFDPFRGVKLSTYAAWWIRAYILRYILNNWRMVKIGTTQAQRKLFFNLRKEKERLEAQGFAPSPKLLAERLDVSEKEVIEMDARMSRPEVSLDAPLFGDSTDTVGDLMPSGGALQDELVARAQMDHIYNQALDEFAQGLTGREAHIYKSRMLGDPPVTLQEIGDQFGVTRERVRQIEARILKKLKKFFEERGIEAPGE